MKYVGLNIKNNLLLPTIFIMKNKLEVEDTDFKKGYL